MHRDPNSKVRVPDSPLSRPLKDRVRWPAEWEPHEATLLSWPWNPETWPGCLDEAEAAFVEIVRALHMRERLEIAVQDTGAQVRVRALLAQSGVDCDARRVRFHVLPTNDAWVRDSGPISVFEEDARVLLDCGFNAWGGKYPPWDLDDALAGRWAEALQLPSVQLKFILEGGSIDGNGAGVVLTTESCLLNSNRGGLRTREGVEGILRDVLGAKRVLWLGDGIVGDDTDGHVDDIARFVGPERIVTVCESDTASPNFAPLQENVERLRAARTLAGKPFEIVSLPMPPPVTFQGAVCPASYANFYIANGAVLVPIFGVASDAEALAILDECIPEREIIGIPARYLVVGLGAVHCLTQQLPQQPPCEPQSVPGVGVQASEGP